MFTVPRRAIARSSGCQRESNSAVVAQIFHSPPSSAQFRMQHIISGDFIRHRSGRTIARGVARIR